MELEEIVALSVKHNVSDLHLCNPPHRAGVGRASWSPPFPAPDIARYSTDWLDADSYALAGHGQIDLR
jgi:twitching motility protein PilT